MAFYVIGDTKETTVKRDIEIPARFPHLDGSPDFMEVDEETTYDIDIEAITGCHVDEKEYYNVSVDPKTMADIKLLCIIQDNLMR